VALWICCFQLNQVPPLVFPETGWQGHLVGGRCIDGGVPDSVLLGPLEVIRFIRIFVVRECCPEFRLRQEILVGFFPQPFPVKFSRKTQWADGYGYVRRRSDTV